MNREGFFRSGPDYSVNNQDRKPLKDKRFYLFVWIVVLGMGGGQAIAFDPDAALREARERAPPEAERERLEAERTALEIARQRYSVKGLDHGIVVDRETGLEWMRCSLGQTWNPQRDTCQGDASEYNWNDAMLLPHLMHEASGHGGYKDWRVPTIDELRTLVFCSNGTPPIDPERVRCSPGYQSPSIFSDIFPNTPASLFWSGSPHSYFSSLAWGVVFSDGGAGGSLRSNNGRVRLVRGGQ